MRPGLLLVLGAVLGVFCGRDAAPSTKMAEEVVNHQKEKFDTFDAPRELFEGDLVGNAEDLMSMAKNALLDSKWRWPSGRMPYEISPHFSSAEVATINSGISLINSVTSNKIYILPRSGEANYVYIARGGADSGCYSKVGMQKGKQVVNLQFDGCIYKGTVAHELLHALGLWHEQSRTDRDSYVEINWSNIAADMQHNFQKYDSSYVTSYQLTYDYGSLMHYTKYTFAIDTNVWTIRPSYPGFQSSTLGQSNQLSTNDIKKLEAMYK